MNSRLDTLQAAILLEKLAIFEDEIAARQKVATRYAEGLVEACLSVPTVVDGGVSDLGAACDRAPQTATASLPISRPRAFRPPSTTRVPMHRQASYAE